MTNTLFNILDILLYYITMILIICRILDKTIRIKTLIFTFLPLYTALMVFSVVLFYDAFVIIHVMFQCIIILQLKLSFDKLKFSTVIGTVLLYHSIKTIFSVSLEAILKMLGVDTLFIQFDIPISICFLLICIAACLNTKLHMHTKELLIVIKGKTKWLTILSLSISALIVAMMLSNPILEHNNAWSVSLRLSIILLAILILTIFPLIIVTTQANYYLKRQNEKFESDLEIQAQYYQKLSLANFELRQFRHDFKNMQIGIKTFLIENDCRGALNMLEETQNGFGYDVAKLVGYDSGNGIVDAILSDKQTKAQQYNTTIIFEGVVPPSLLSPVDVCVLFGNTIDNAVEACAKIQSENKKIISVNSKCVSGFMFVRISNPIAEDVVIKNNMIRSTKEDQHLHGYGLRSLHKIVKKYNGELNLFSKNKMFTVEIDLHIHK